MTDNHILYDNDPRLLIMERELGTKFAHSEFYKKFPVHEELNRAITKQQKKHAFEPITEDDVLDWERALARAIKPDRVKDLYWRLHKCSFRGAIAFNPHTENPLGRAAEYFRLHMNLLAWRLEKDPYQVVWLGGDKCLMARLLLQEDKP